MVSVLSLVKSMPDPVLYREYGRHEGALFVAPASSLTDATHVEVPQTAWGPHTGTFIFKSNFELLSGHYGESVVSVRCGGFSAIAVAVGGVVDDELAGHIEDVSGDYETVLDQSTYEQVIMRAEQNDWNSFGREMVVRALSTMIDEVDGEVVDEIMMDLRNEGLMPWQESDQGVYGFYVKDDAWEAARRVKEELIKRQ